MIDGGGDADEVGVVAALLLGLAAIISLFELSLLIGVHECQPEDEEKKDL